MNYIEWSNEYYDTAMRMNDVINKLKNNRKGASLSEKKELDSKIIQYKAYFNECMSISNHLMARHQGVD
jgi:hypothetical protein